MPATVHQTQNSFGKAAHSIRVAGTMQTALSSRNVMKLTFSGGSERSVSCYWKTFANGFDKIRSRTAIAVNAMFAKIVRIAVYRTGRRSFLEILHPNVFISGFFPVRWSRTPYMSRIVKGEGFFPCPPA